jgi:hypothetical protein
VFGIYQSIGLKDMGENKKKKQVAIQRRIEEVMNEEFVRMLAESGDDPLIKLIQEGEIDSLSLKDIKTRLKGVNNE